MLYLFQCVYFVVNCAYVFEQRTDAQGRFVKVAGAGAISETGFGEACQKPENTENNSTICDSLYENYGDGQMNAQGYHSRADQLVGLLSKI